MKILSQCHLSMTFTEEFKFTNQYSEIHMLTLDGSLCFASLTFAISMVTIIYLV